MKNKKILKSLSKVLLAFALVTTTLLPTGVDLSAAKTNQYFWSSLYDAETKMFRATIVDDESQNPDEHKYSKLNTTANYFEINMSRTTRGANRDTMLDEGITRKEKKGKTYPYTFPGNIGHEVNIEGTSQDRQQALTVSSKLTNELNEVMRTVATKSGVELTSLTDAEYFNNVNTVINAANNPASTFTLNCSAEHKSITFYFKNGIHDGASVITTDGLQGSEESDFVTLYVSKDGGDEVIKSFQYKVPKGYHSGQHLASTFNTSDLADWIPSHLSWSHVFYQAYYMYQDNFTAANIGELSEISSFEALIAGILSSVLSNLQGLLGLYSLDELMLNVGNRATETYQGIMPKTWFIGVSILYSACMVVALIVIGYGIVKLMIQKNMSTINVSQRVSLKEGIMDLAWTAILIALFYPAFLIVCRFNTFILEVLYSLVAEKQTLQALLLGKNAVGIGIGAVIIAFAAFFAALKLNVTYVIRSLTIALLFATAPYFVSTYSIPGKKEKFWSWLKELLANIFMQTFDGVIAVFLILVLSISPMRAFERIALAFAMLSLSSYFKNSVVKMGTDAEKVGDRASGVLATVMGNAMVGLVAGIGHNAAPSNKQQGQQRQGGNETTAGDDANGEKFVSTSAHDTANKVIKQEGGFKDTLGKISNNPFVKGAGHITRSLAYTGISAGTQLAGGRTFWGEKHAADELQHAQDEIWDRGIKGGIDNFKDKFLSDDYDHVVEQNALKQSGASSIQTTNPDTKGEAGKGFVSLKGDGSGKDPRHISGVRIVAQQNSNPSESNFTKQELKNISNNLDSQNDGVRISRFNKQTGSWNKPENLSVQQFKKVLNETHPDKKIRLDEVIQGGEGYSDATVTTRPLQKYNEKGKLETVQTYSVADKNGDHLDVYNLNALAGRNTEN